MIVTPRRRARIPLSCIAAIFCLVLALAASVLAQSDKEEEEFLYAHKLYNDKLYDVVVAQFNQFLEDYPNSPHRPQAF